jgi:hypothetical protein
MSACSPRLTAFVLAAAVVTVGLPELSGQQTPELVLVETDAVRLSAPVPLYVGTVRCDAEGNTYFRFAVSLGDLNAPVTKVSPSGEVGTKFSLASVPDVTLREEATIRDFALDNRERVYLLLSKDAKAFIAVFSADGRFNNTIELIQSNFFPTQLVVFSSGQYLVSGILKTNRAGPATGRLFTGIFDGFGNLVKEINLPPVSPFERSIPISAEPGAHLVVPGGISYARIFHAGIARRAVAGDDDNAYMLLLTSPPVVCVVTSGGTLVRTLKITPPAEGLTPGALVEGSGQLLVTFGKLVAPSRVDRVLVKLVVYDASTGKALVRYGLSSALSGYPSCYTPSSAAFFDLTEKGPVLIHAVPR